MLISEEDLHDHLRARMAQRGIRRDEIQRVLSEGSEAADAKPGTYGKVLVFQYNEEWEGQIYRRR